jgi:hypothetical protein
LLLLLLLLGTLLLLLRVVVVPVLLVVHQDLGNVELRDRRHAPGPLGFHVPLELPRVVDRVEEAQHNPSADFFLDTLEAQFAP